MTTQTATSQNEFSWIGKSSHPESESAPPPVVKRESSPPESAPPPDNVVFATFGPSEPGVHPGFMSLSEMLESFEGDIELQEMMKIKRTEIVSEFYTDENSFTALRLRAGLSQRQLASLSKTSQSHIATIEKGDIDPSTSTVARIARALNVDETVVYTAVRRALCQHRSAS